MSLAAIGKKPVPWPTSDLLIWSKPELQFENDEKEICFFTFKSLLGQTIFLNLFGMVHTNIEATLINNKQKKRKDKTLR